MNPFRLQIHPQHLASFKAVAPVLYVLTGGVIAAWAYFSVASPQRVGHYLTLHQVLETLSIAVSALVFPVGWKAHSLNPQRNVLILACGFFWAWRSWIFRTCCHLLACRTTSRQTR